MAEVSRFAQLIIKHLTGISTAEEEEELKAWRKESPDNRRFMEEDMKVDVIDAQLLALWEMDDLAIDQRLYPLDKTLLPIGDTPPPPLVIPMAKPARVQLKWAVKAAIVISILLVGIYQYAHSTFSASRSHSQLSVLKASGQPEPRPQLWLSKDSVLYLDSLPVGIPIQIGRWNIYKITDHCIIYQLRDKTAQTNEIEDNAYNIITTPEDGPGWRVELPDSSRIVLAAGSALAFPLHPSGAPLQQRVLTLNGQAMIDVAHNAAIPFIVESPQGETQALGTTFLIRDYGRENTFSALLYNGRLSVNSGKHKESLYPAQKATIDGMSSKISIASGISLPLKQPWPREMFDFSHSNLTSAIHELANWYGMSRVQFVGDVDTVTLGILGEGHLSKDLASPLPDLLRAMEKKDLHFDVVGKTIIVSR